jgi:hypothetical protein
MLTCYSILSWLYGTLVWNCALLPLPAVIHVPAFVVMSYTWFMGSSANTADDEWLRSSLLSILPSVLLQVVLVCGYGYRSRAAMLLNLLRRTC